MTLRSPAVFLDHCTSISKGVSRVATEAGQTLGRWGSNVAVLETSVSPAASLPSESSDEFEEIGLRTAREVVDKTWAEVGDGAATAAVLAETIFNDTLSEMRRGTNLNALQTGVRKAVEDVVGELQRMSDLPSRETIFRAAKLAAKIDEPTECALAEAIKQVRSPSAISIEQGGTKDTEVGRVSGIHFDSGYLSQHFVTNQDEMLCELEKPYILAYSGTISSSTQLSRILEQVTHRGSSFFVIAKNVSAKVLAELAIKNVRGELSCAVVRAPGSDKEQDEFLDDFVVLTGSQLIFPDDNVQLKGIELDHLGRCQRIVIDAERTKILAGANPKDELQLHCARLERRIKRIRAPERKRQQQDRLDRLAGEIARIQLGTSGGQIAKQKSLFESALNAMRLATEKGVVPGGGMALYRAAQQLTGVRLTNDEQVGYEIVRRACEVPMSRIAKNAGANPQVVIDELKEMHGRMGYNATSGGYEDLMQAGIVDITTVPQVALRNAAWGVDNLVKAAEEEEKTTPVTRYLCAGFYLVDEGRPVTTEQPLSLDGGPYELGVNIAREFWGPGRPDVRVPEKLFRKDLQRLGVLEFDVVAESLNVEIVPSVKPLKLPSSADSQLVTFLLLLSRPGRQAIDVRLFYRGHLLQSRRLEFEVVSHAGDPVPVSGRPVQDGYITFSRTAELDAQCLKNFEQDPSGLTIVAARDQDTDRIGLHFYTMNGKKLGPPQVSKLDYQNLSTPMTRVRNQLTETMEAYKGTLGGGEKVFTKYLGQLAEAGRSFYLSLLPELAKRSGGTDQEERLTVKLKPGQTIQVAQLSNQLSVPWELLYEWKIESYTEDRIKLCDRFREHPPDLCPYQEDETVVCPHGFWGFRYVIEQLPCRVNPRRPLPSTLPVQVKNDVPLRLQAFVYTGFDLRDHLNSLNNLVASDQLELTSCKSKEEAKTAIKDRIRAADVLYFLTHGGSEKDSPFLVVGEKDRLSYVDLDSWDPTFAGHHPLVILSACESADYSPDDFENLIQFFCERGAAGVIGTQCPVQLLLAKSLVIDFFQSFLGKAPAGEALFAARHALLRKLDPRGLAYSLFAAAEVKLAKPLQVKGISND